MKTAITVTLIIAGVFLILFPAMSDLYTRQQLVAVLNGPPNATSPHSRTSVDLGVDPMSTPYRVFCWLIGTGMISVAVSVSLQGSAEHARSGRRMERRGDQSQSMAHDASFRDFMKSHPEFANAPNALRESAFKSWLRQPKSTV